MSRRILVLGGDGMLGHQLLQHFKHRHEVLVTLRNNSNAYKAYNIFSRKNAVFEVEARNTSQLNKIFKEFRPEVVVNCIGIVKQRKEAVDAIESIKYNALLPHQLCLLCKEYTARLIQISTDCVFSGNKGNYVESDIPDATNLYGRTKLLGEISSSNTVTLRSPFIGIELSRKQGLIEWFLAQRGIIQGYVHAIYSGLTTTELASVIEQLIMQHSDLSGIWHVSSAPISKYQILCSLADKLNREDIEIKKDEEFKCDRSLDSSKFMKATSYMPPSWDEMLSKLAEQIINQK